MGLLQCLVVSQMLWICSQGVPESPTITEARVLSSTSATLSWTPISNVDSYELSYMRARGHQQNGDCKTYLHADTLFIDGESNTYTLEGLEEFSTYSVSVAAVDSTGRSQQSKFEQFDTFSAAPSSPPTSVTATVNSSTVVVVTWNPVPCIDRNSVITEYSVIIDSYHDTRVPAETHFGEIRHVIYGLTPSYSYKIQVAAVNSNGSTGTASPGIYEYMPYPAESVHVQFKGRAVHNHGFVLREEMGEGREALLCLTNSYDCCHSYYRRAYGYFVGEWYHPNGTVVLNNAAGQNMYRGRAESLVRLSQRGNGGVIGIYRCEIPDEYFNIVTLYVGIYTEGTGEPEITNVHFNLLSEKDATNAVFEINCITSGGPVEHSEWTRYSGSIPEGSHTNKTIQDTLNAVYHNKLTVSGRYPGLYSCTISSTRPTYTVIRSENITIEAADSPTNLTVDLEGITSIHLTWVAPESGDSVTGYLLYVIEFFERDRRTLEVNSSSTEHQVHNLRYGGIYFIHLVALSKHLPSPVVGPIETTIGIPDPVVSLSAFPDVTSINVTWDPPIEPHGNIERYQVEYWTIAGGRDEKHSIFVINNETVLTSLLPETTYVIAVRPYTFVGDGDPVMLQSTTFKLYTVKNIEIDAVSATNTRVSWSPVAIPFWKLTHYTLYYSAYSNALEKIVDSRLIHVDSEEVPPTSYVIQIVELSDDVEHRVEVTANLEVQENAYESDRSKTTVFNFDVVPFQLQFSPVEYCASWSPNKSMKMEEAIHNGIVKAVSRLCNCTFSVDFIRSGVFRCWNSPTEVTYRSAIVSTDTYYASDIVGYIEKWVESKPALLLHLEKLELKVETKCPVRLTLMSDPECPLVHTVLNETMSLVSSDIKVIDCMKKCMGEASSCTP